MIYRIFFENISSKDFFPDFWVEYQHGRLNCLLFSELFYRSHMRGMSCIIIYTEFTENDAFRMHSRFLNLTKLIELFCPILKIFKMKKMALTISKILKAKYKFKAKQHGPLNR